VSAELLTDDFEMSRQQGGGR